MEQEAEKSIHNPSLDIKSSYSVSSCNVPRLRGSNSMIVVRRTLAWDGCRNEDIFSITPIVFHLMPILQEERSWKLMLDCTNTATVQVPARICDYLPVSVSGISKSEAIWLLIPAVHRQSSTSTTKQCWDLERNNYQSGQRVDWAGLSSKFHKPRERCIDGTVHWLTLRRIQYHLLAMLSNLEVSRLLDSIFDPARKLQRLFRSLHLEQLLHLSMLLSVVQSSFTNKPGVELEREKQTFDMGHHLRNSDYQVAAAWIPISTCIDMQSHLSVAIRLCSSKAPLAQKVFLSVISKQQAMDLQLSDILMLGFPMIDCSICLLAIQTTILSGLVLRVLWKVGWIVWTSTGGLLIRCHDQHVRWMIWRHTSNQTYSCRYPGFFYNEVVIRSRSIFNEFTTTHWAWGSRSPSKLTSSSIISLWEGRTTITTNWNIC